MVGINTYTKCNPLYGAVNDAKAFAQWLREDLQVPESNIQELFDDSATRANIINGLDGLLSNPGIVKDQTAILIYFAGHGSSTNKPDDWEEWDAVGGKVEMICPVDIGTSSDRGTLVQGISDREISSFLDRLAQAKGNNIVSTCHIHHRDPSDKSLLKTLIFDSCHASGITRTGEEQPPDGAIARTILDPPKFTSDMILWDEKHTHRTTTQTMHGFSGFARQSYILLAACSANEKAWEDDQQRGVFTTALLKLLRSHDVQNLTYASLCHRLELPEQ